MAGPSGAAAGLVSSRPAPAPAQLRPGPSQVSWTRWAQLPSPPLLGRLKLALRDNVLILPASKHFKINLFLLTRFLRVW